MLICKIFIIPKVVFMNMCFCSDDSMIKDNGQFTDGCPSSKWCRLYKCFDKTLGMIVKIGFI